MSTVKVLVISDYRGKVSVRPEAELFIGLQQAGVQVTIMTYGDAEYATKFRQVGIRVIDFHPQKKFSREAVRRIRQELITGGYHILHLFNSKAIVNGIRAARNLPVKVVLYRGYTGNIHWYDPTAYLKYLHPRVDKITCLAKSIEEDLQAQLFFDKRKTITINKGHSLDWYADVQPVSREEIAASPEDFVITCAANARRMKGIRYLIQATYHLPENLPIHLFLVGNNMDTTDLQKLTEKSPNRDRIHVLGFRKDSLRIVAASDVFVLPSIKGEATTKAVMEAMSLGVPVIATSIAGNRELAIHRQSAYVIPPRDPKAIAGAILELYHHPALRHELGQKGRQHVATNFTIQKTIAETKALYETLAAPQLTPAIP